jgi:hypothetical protein
MAYTNKLTVVSTDLVCADYKVLAEMTDGSLIELSTPWGCPDERSINHYWNGWRNRTHSELIELARNHNADRRFACNTSLHLDKVRRLGHDYAARGY